MKKIEKKTITVKEVIPENMYICVKDLDTLTEYETYWQFNLKFIHKFQ